MRRRTTTDAWRQDPSARPAPWPAALSSTTIGVRLSREDLRATTPAGATCRRTRKGRVLPPCQGPARRFKSHSKGTETTTKCRLAPSSGHSIAVSTRQTPDRTINPRTWTAACHANGSGRRTAIDDPIAADHCADLKTGHAINESALSDRTCKSEEVELGVGRAKPY